MFFNKIFRLRQVSWLFRSTSICWHDESFGLINLGTKTEKSPSSLRREKLWKCLWVFSRKSWSYEENIFLHKQQKTLWCNFSSSGIWKFPQTRSFKFQDLSHFITHLNRKKEMKFFHEVSIKLSFWFMTLLLPEIYASFTSKTFYLRTSKERLSEFISQISRRISDEGMSWSLVLYYKPPT